MKEKRGEEYYMKGYFEDGSKPQKSSYLGRGSLLYDT